nr:uncharacterized protein LOC129283323 [Lytechinus pictus]
MPRCHSLSELDKRKGITSPVNGLIVPYLETNGALHGKERAGSRSSVDEARTGARTSRGHNYSTNSVKMKFGGKFGSLKKNVDDARLDNLRGSKTSENLVKGTYHTERSSGGIGPKSEGSATDAQGIRKVFEKAESKLPEMDGKVNLEDCWLSASFPPPSLSGFSTFLQGCTNRGTPRPGSSRPSSEVSIGELDRWLFPGDNASPSLTGGQPVKKVSTPWVLSPTSTYSSPPKLTTQASPAGHGVALASPRPLLPQANHLHLSPHHPLADASSGMGPEPLFTSTPKSPKPSAPSIRYFSSDVSSNQSVAGSVSYSGDDTIPYQTIHCPQDQGEDLGKLKPLEGIPLEQHSAHATKSQNIFQKQSEVEVEQVYPKEKLRYKCSPSPDPQDEPLPVMPSSSSKTSTLPPYLMRSKALAAAQVPEKACLLSDPMLRSVDSCSSSHGLVNTGQVSHPSIERLSNLQSGHLRKDSPVNHSASIRLIPSMHQLQTISSRRVIKALPKPPLSLQNLPKSQDSVPIVRSGLDAGSSHLRRPPPGYQMQQRVPQSQFRCTLNGTPYTIHVRPYKGSHFSSRTPSAGCIRFPERYPTTQVNKRERCHQETVPLMRSPLNALYPLQGAPGPSPGCTPKFTTQVNPTPATKTLPLGSFPPTSHVSGMIAQEVCRSSVPGVTCAPPLYRPWTVTNQAARGPSVSTASVPHTGLNAAVASSIQASGSTQI